MEDEDRIIKEAQLMRVKAKDFNPYGGLLTVWRGIVYGRGRFKSQPFEIEIRIPPDFPRAPPKIYAITPMQHPSVDENGEIMLDILKKWNPSIHLYEVVNSLKAAFALQPPIPKVVAALPAPTVFVPPPPEPTLTTKTIAPQMMSSPASGNVVTEDVIKLKELLKKKEEELQKLRENVERLIDESTKKTMSKEDLEIERDAIVNLLEKLEEKFVSGEIKIEDYAKYYKKYVRELYLIKKQLGEL